MSGDANVAWADPSGAFSVSAVVRFVSVAAGQTRALQVWRRDQAGSCSTTSDVTDALAVVCTQGPRPVWSSGRTLSGL